MVDVSHLVSQMHETLSTIHDTIASLSTAEHDAKLDALEQQRDESLAALQSKFDAESDTVSRDRDAELQDIADRRRKEDEEREARRRREDEELAGRLGREDDERHGKFHGEKREVEEDTDSKMENIEGEAQKMLEEGRSKLAALEEKRQEINRLIDEQLKMPLPTAPTRRRVRGGQMPPAIAANSKPQAPTPAPADDHVGNNNVKALNEKAPATPQEPSSSSGEAVGDEQPQARDLSGSASSHEDGNPTTGEAAAEAAAEASGEEDAATEDVQDALEPETNPIGPDTEDQPLPTDYGHGHEYANQFPENHPKRGDSKQAANPPDEEDNAQSSSLFGKIGGAMLSLVGSSGHSNEDTGDHADGSHGREKRLSAPGEYPMSEVHSPMEQDEDHERNDQNAQDSADKYKPWWDPVGDAMEEPKNEQAERGHSGSPDEFRQSQGENDNSDDQIPSSSMTTDAEIPKDANNGPPTLPNVELGYESASREENEQQSTAPVDHSAQSPTNGSGEFDMSGNKPIPGTMTHGIDGAEKLTTVGTRHMDPKSLAEGDREVQTPTQVSALEPQETDPRQDERNEDAEQITSQEDPNTARDNQPDESDASAESFRPGSNVKREESMEHDGSSEDADEQEAHHSQAPNTIPTPYSESDDEPTAHEFNEDQALGTRDEVPTDGSHRHMDASGLDKDLGPLNEEDDGFSTETPMGEESQDNYDEGHQSQDEDGEAEPRTPTESKPEKHGENELPFIEYVSRDSHADSPEHLQDSSITREPRIGRDVFVPEGGSGLDQLAPEIGHLEGDDEGYAPTPDLDTADPGLDDGLDYMGTSYDGRAHSDYLSAGDASPDNDSLPFVTPLQSSGFRSPLTFEDGGDQPADEMYRADRAEYDDAGWGTENAVTVHGQDDLFEDDYSDESAKSDEPDVVTSAHDDAGDQSVTEHIITTPVGDHEHDDLPQTAVPTTNSHDNAPDHQRSGLDIEPSGDGSGAASFTSDSGYRSETPHDLLDRAGQGGVDHEESEPRHSTPHIHPAGEQAITDEISPLSLRHNSPSTPFKGLANSRHAPPREPVTPPRQTPPHRGEQDHDSSAIVPRDVTDIPWHARHDSIPMSLHSQTTLSSSPSSPIHASLPIDNHEPVIRDSWPGPPHQHLLSGMGGNSPERIRSDSLLSHSDYDPFKYDPANGGKSPLAAKWAARGDPASITPPSNPPSQRNSVATASPSGLFQKMRSIFEPPSSSDTERGANVTPPRSRPVSGVWFPVGRGSPRATEDIGYDAPDDKRGGFLNEADHEVDERSALLNSADGH